MGAVKKRNIGLPLLLALTVSWSILFRMKVTLDLPDEALIGLALPPRDLPARLRLETACGLYQQELLSLGQCATLAGVHPFVFSHELSRREIARHYGDEELAADAEYVSKCADG